MVFNLVVSAKIIKHLWSPYRPFRWFAMTTHLLPCLLWHFMRRRSSSLLHEFLRTFGSSLLCHLHEEFYLNRCYLTFHDTTSRFLSRPSPSCWVSQQSRTSAWCRSPQLTSAETYLPKLKVLKRIRLTLLRQQRRFSWLNSSICPEFRKLVCLA